MPLPASNKRKAEDASQSKQPAKKRRRRAKAEDNDHLDLDNSLNIAIGQMDSQLLSDYLGRMTARSGKDLSPVELSDLSLSASSFKDATAWQERRTLDRLPDFLEHFTENPDALNAAPEKKGAPHTLVVAAAALRAADIVRTARKFSSNKDNVVAKLFAKHMKPEEQERVLKKSRTGFAVGTPARLSQLIDKGKSRALSLDCLERIVVDASHIDQKRMGIMEIKDTMLQLARLLARTDLKARYADEEKPVALLFY